MSRYRYKANVQIAAQNSHTGEPRTIPAIITIEAKSETDATQRAADVGFQLGLMLVGPA